MKHDREKIIPQVLEAIATGSSLRAICDRIGVGPSAFLKWIDTDETGALREQYAHARELQAEHYADEIIRIADTTEDAQLGRLQVDARKWIASKLLPKKYGDKVDVTSKGEQVSLVINVPPLDGGPE